MRKSLLSLLLCLLLINPLSAAQGPAKLDKLYDSVAALIGEGAHCTAVSVRVGQWLTAEHCIKRMPTGMVLNGEVVTVIAQDEKVDLALVKGPVASILPVAEREPELGEPVVILGWPNGWTQRKPLMFFGRVQAVGFEASIENGPKQRYNAFHEGGGSGVSGGPVVNGEGKLVGLANAIAAYPSISLVGQSVKTIRKFLGMKGSEAE